MRLLFFINSLSGGGAERVTANLANYWVRKGWNITIVTLAPVTKDFYRLEPAVYRIALELPGESGNAAVASWHNLCRVAALRRVLKNARPDIAIGMMDTANVVLALASWGLPHVRAIGVEHTHPPQLPLGAVWEWLRRHTYSQLAAVTGLTRESAAWLRTYTNSRRVAVIPNAVWWPLTSHGRNVNPASVCPAGRPLLLASGRLDREKGFDRLIQAFAAIASKFSSWDLVILGEGKERFALESLVQALGLKSRVLLPGLVGNIAEWYKSTDIYVMSSRFEGFGNTLAEALGYGIPAVSFDCDTGPRHIIRHGIDGLLVPREDVAALSDALDRLMGDSALRRRFAERAVEARNRFSMERVAVMWEELFEDIGN